MALTLLVERDRWREHLARAVSARPGLVPVVKGNGYGFGRERLLTECRRLGLGEVAVGTAWELFMAISDVQTGRLEPIPVILVGSDWTNALLPYFEYMKTKGMISAPDVPGPAKPEDGTSAQRFKIVQTPEETVAAIESIAN